jgi:hypothetical protein
MTKLSVVPVLLALVAALSSSSNAACPCLYTDEDAEDCIVYGKIDGELVRWMRAPQECLDVLDIRVNAPDPSLICASSNGFVNSLRSGLLSSSTVKYGLGVSQMEGGFWVEGNNNFPVIKDSITINDITTACTGTDEVNCYTAMKPYFENDAGGKQEMADACETLEKGVRNALELEQSTTRLRLCLEDEQGFNIRQECDSIWAEVSQRLEENPDRECQFVSFGPGTTTLPECDGDGGGDGDKGGDSARQVGTVGIGIVVSLSLMLTNMMLW